MGVNEPQCRANLDPRGMVGRIYVDDHYTLLHTKYVCCGPCGFREEDFLFFIFFSIISLWELMNDPRGMLSKIYVGDHLTLLHTQYISYRPHGFKKEDF